jgi:flagellum-specific peptidoglycan hydrolase FlgJ
MDAKSQKNLFYLALGGIGLYLASKSASSVVSTGSSSDQTPGLLDSLTSGITNAVATLTGSKQADFITKMQPIAHEIGGQYGIDPLIIMTQAALESGWGTSGLTKKANNLYGYTGDAALRSWLASKGLPANTDMQTILNMDLSAAPFIIMQTHEEVSDSPHQYFERPGDLVSQNGTDAMVYRPFRRYDSWQSSVNDWVALMRTSRYAAAWADLMAGDLNGFSNDVYAAGYATESDYPTQLVSVGSEIGSAIGTA